MVLEEARRGRGRSERPALLGVVLTLLKWGTSKPESVVTHNQLSPVLDTCLEHLLVTTGKWESKIVLTTSLIVHGLWIIWILQSVYTNKHFSILACQQNKTAAPQSSYHNCTAQCSSSAYSQFHSCMCQGCPKNMNQSSNHHRIHYLNLMNHWHRY